MKGNMAEEDVKGTKRSIESWFPIEPVPQLINVFFNDVVYIKSFHKAI